MIEINCCIAVLPQFLLAGSQAFLEAARAAKINLYKRLLGSGSRSRAFIRRSQSQEPGTGEKKWPDLEHCTTLNPIRFNVKLCLLKKTFDK